jgi:hypothetical protein
MDMAMGARRQRERQQDLWIASSDVAETPGNAFYDRLNQILEAHKFDGKVEHLVPEVLQGQPRCLTAHGAGCLLSDGWTRSEGSRGGRRTRCRYAGSWGTRWTGPRRTIPRFRVRGAVRSVVSAFLNPDFASVVSRRDGCIRD